MFATRKIRLLVFRGKELQTNTCRSTLTPNSIYRCCLYPYGSQVCLRLKLLRRNGWDKRHSLHGLAVMRRTGITARGSTLKSSLSLIWHENPSRDDRLQRSDGAGPLLWDIYVLNQVKFLTDMPVHNPTCYLLWLFK